MTFTFAVNDPLSLTLRRLELLATTAARWESTDSSFRAELPPDAAGEDSISVALHAAAARRRGQTVMCIQVRPLATGMDAALPPREASRPDLRDALSELLAEGTTPTSSPGPHSVFFWALSTLTIFGVGEEFLLRLRENHFRRPIFDRLAVPWPAHHRTRRSVAHLVTAALLLSAALLAAVS